MSSLPHQIKGDPCKEQAEHIVPFKPALSMLMVAAVYEPKRTVEQIFMYEPGEYFHPCDSPKNNSHIDNKLHASGNESVWQLQMSKFENEQISK